MIILFSIGDMRSLCGTDRYTKTDLVFGFSENYFEMSIIRNEKSGQYVAKYSFTINHV